MNITVFGSARPQPQDKLYQDALQLGSLLAQAGHTVMTGGYCGTMEAVSRGASEAGGHVIGVTCEEIEQFRPSGPNPWVKEEWRFRFLSDRLNTLIERCDGAIALPGGAGTLTEITLMWNRSVIGSIPSRPLVVIGSGWKTVFTTLFEMQYEHIQEIDRRRLFFADQIDQAVSLLFKILNN